MVPEKEVSPVFTEVTEVEADGPAACLKRVISFIETGVSELCTQTEAGVAFVDDVISLSSSETSVEDVLAAAAAVEQNGNGSLASAAEIVETRPDVQREDEKTWAAVAAAQIQLETGAAVDDEDDGSDIEVVVAPPLVVEVLEAAPLPGKDVDEEGFEKILSKKTKRERREHSMTDPGPDTDPDVVGDILKVDIERSPKAVHVPIS